jgi:hypothetical protein
MMPSYVLDGVAHDRLGLGLGQGIAVVHGPRMAGGARGREGSAAARRGG